MQAVFLEFGVLQYFASLVSVKAVSFRSFGWLWLHHRSLLPFDFVCVWFFFTFVSQSSALYDSLGQFVLFRGRGSCSEFWMAPHGLLRDCRCLAQCFGRWLLGGCLLILRVVCGCCVAFRH